MNSHTPPFSLIYGENSQYTTPEFENLMARFPVGHNKGDFADLLTDIQGNILCHHNKKYSRFYFINFNIENYKEEKIHKALNWIQDISDYVTTAKKQFENRKGPVCCFYLSWEGYRILGLKHLAPVSQNSRAFDQGFRNRVNLSMEKEFYDKYLYPKAGDKNIHAMLMIASDDPNFSDFSKKALELVALLDSMQQKPASEPSVSVQIAKFKPSKKKVTAPDWANVTKQNGLIKRKDFGLNKEKMVEWFGFRDGVSQPVFFPDALGTSRYENVLPLGIVLTRDKGGQHWYSAGSFLVFAKFEQNVKQFLENVQNIQKEMTGTDVDLAAAYIMGRFQDGTSVSLSNTPKNDIENDFNYSRSRQSDIHNISDEKGIKCPFAAHARKANPRMAKEIVPIVRRGVLYDDRTQTENLNTEAADWQDLKKLKDSVKNAPTGKIGLLFMSFQSSIEKQFEYIMNNWLLSVNTGGENTGVDMLTGTGGSRNLSRWQLPKTWGSENANENILFSSEEIKSCIHFKGGEYFFAPSVSFLKTVQRNTLVPPAPPTPPDQTIAGNNVNSRFGRRGFKVPRINLKHD
jgi:Dyp-type peroxidase family